MKQCNKCLCQVCIKAKDCDNCLMCIGTPNQKPLSICSDFQSKKVIKEVRAQYGILDGVGPNIKNLLVKMGISLFTPEGEGRKIEDILKEIDNKWDEYHKSQE